MLRHWRPARAKKEQLGEAFTKMRLGKDARSNITIKRGISKYATSQRKALAPTLSLVVLTDVSDGVEHGSDNWRQGSGGVCDGYLPNKAFTCEGRLSAGGRGPRLHPRLSRLLHRPRADWLPHLPEQPADRAAAAAFAVAATAIAAPVMRPPRRPQTASR